MVQFSKHRETDKVADGLGAIVMHTVAGAWPFANRGMMGDSFQNCSTKPMKENIEKVKLLARDLRDGKSYPRGPRETLAGYVLAARAVDKCRSVLAGCEGEYHSNCPLDQRWLKFAEIHYW